MDKYPNIKHWYICGHSMGGAMASSYVSKNKDKVEVYTPVKDSNL